MNEDKFYNELGNVSEPAEDLFAKIEKKIERRKGVSRKFYALAASVILILSLFVNNENNSSKVSSTIAVSDEVIEELQIIDDYLNGSSIDDEMDMYAYSGLY